MQLTDTELNNLREDGFTVVPDVLPGRLRENALRRINAYLSSINMDKEGPNYQFMGELSTADEITDLFHHTPVAALAQSLIGDAGFEDDIRAQMALRFPTGNTTATPREGWHLDSLLRSDGEPTASGPFNFSLLIGFCLSDVSTPGRGNFTVRRGGHRILAEHFREHGTEDLSDVPTRIELPPPHEVCANSGDVIFCHHQVPHGASENVSGDVRYMFFIRLRRVGRADLVREAMLDPFFEWDGMPDANSATAPGPR